MNINYETRKKMGEILDKPGAVYGGRWDKAIRLFQDRYKVQSLIKHFEQGVRWENTEYYQRCLKKIERNNEWRDCRSESELRDFFNYFDRLYDRIKEEGYKSQVELIEKYPEETMERINDVCVPEQNEIGVNIGRNGDFFWQCRGQHRLCIAQLLEVDEVPVQVLTRHRKWQKVRNEIRTTETIDSLSPKARKNLAHPDLRDIIPEEWENRIE